jgi:hypothetical protein
MASATAMRLGGLVLQTVKNLPDVGMVSATARKQRTTVPKTADTHVATTSATVTRLGRLVLRIAKNLKTNNHPMLLQIQA